MMNWSTRNNSFSFFPVSLSASMVTVQKRNMMVKPEAIADIVLIIIATFPAEGAAMANRRPSNWKRGAPGGWPTCSLAAVEMYSPQSQRLAVGSAVEI